MPYDTILFDLDHTLLDSDASERAAYAHTVATFGVPDPDTHFDRYVAINRTMWAAVERGEMSPAEVRFRRFERFATELGLDADPVAMANAFVWGLGAHGELYDGALAVLTELARRARLALVTNGLSDVQRARLQRTGIGHFFDAVVISSEVGATKPRPQIFAAAFEALGGPDPSGAVMVGDSLTSDIQGGRDYGLATCWFNRHGDDAGPDHPVTHEVTTLAELLHTI